MVLRLGGSTAEVPLYDLTLEARPPRALTSERAVAWRAVVAVLDPWPHQGTAVQILSTDLSCTSEGVLYQHMRASTYGSQGGDSGGTIYGIAVYTVDAYLAGFHHGLCLTGGYGTYRMYTSVSAVSAHLGVAGWYTQ